MSRWFLFLIADWNRKSNRIAREQMVQTALRVRKRGIKVRARGVAPSAPQPRVNTVSVMSLRPRVSTARASLCRGTLPRIESPRVQQSVDFEIAHCAPQAAAPLVVASDLRSTAALRRPFPLVRDAFTRSALNRQLECAHWCVPVEYTQLRLSRT